MPSTKDMAWFKREFHANVAVATAGTPFDLSLITALASQETGIIWGPLSRKGLTAREILDVCVGDVITAPRRKAFPRDAEELKAWPRGPEMYDLARRELAAMAKKVPGFDPYVPGAHRFCHAYGILQCDIQHFKTTPDYFLNREYADIDKGLARAVSELKEQQARLPTLRDKTKLTDVEMAQVAIAYNTGGYNPAKGLKQGFKNAEGQYYGELILEYLRAARTVPDPGAGGAVELPKPINGQAPVAQPSPITATGDVYRVDTITDPLNLRAEANTTSAIRVRMPDNSLVRSFGEPVTNGFLRVQFSVNGARFEGFANAANLVLQPPATPVPVVSPAAKPPTKGAVAASLPHKPGHITRRADEAGAYSLNEPGQPRRSGTTTPARLADLASIIDWLDCQNPAHRRYRPRDNTTFCNIYAHDYCFLAGVYLPRVWWLGSALVQLGKGAAVQPSYGKTVEEVRANGLLGWLDDFGPSFGWRQTSSLSNLQAEANLGAVGLVVARRVKSIGPGHIAVVAPETAKVRARRDAAGEVTLPVLSQAGSTNVRRGAPANAWWIGPKFESHAYWLHA